MAAAEQFFSEKPLKRKPFVVYPYAFYNKYGEVWKEDLKSDPVKVQNTYPRLN